MCIFASYSEDAHLEVAFWTKNVLPPRPVSVHDVHFWYRNSRFFVQKMYMIHSVGTNITRRSTIFWAELHLNICHCSHLSLIFLELIGARQKQVLGCYFIWCAPKRIVMTSIVFMGGPHHMKWAVLDTTMSQPNNLSLSEKIQATEQATQSCGTVQK